MSFICTPAGNFLDLAILVKEPPQAQIYIPYTSTDAKP